jgi:hypothetical protein
MKLVMGGRKVQARRATIYYFSDERDLAIASVGRAVRSSKSEAVITTNGGR